MENNREIIQALPLATYNLATLAINLKQKSPMQANDVIT